MDNVLEESCSVEQRRKGAAGQGAVAGARSVGWPGARVRRAAAAAGRLLAAAHCLPKAFWMAVRTLLVATAISHWMELTFGICSSGGASQRRTPGS